MFLRDWLGMGRLAAWRAMETIKSEGKTKAIGVSNYAPRHLEEILDAGMTMPEVNQIELRKHIHI